MENGTEAQTNFYSFSWIWCECLQNFKHGWNFNEGLLWKGFRLTRSSKTTLTNHHPSRDASQSPMKGQWLRASVLRAASSQNPIVIPSLRWHLYPIPVKKPRICQYKDQDLCIFLESTTTERLQHFMPHVIEDGSDLYDSNARTAFQNDQKPVLYLLPPYFPQSMRTSFDHFFTVQGSGYASKAIGINVGAQQEKAK